MDQRPRAHSTLHIRPPNRTSKLLHGFQQFKGIIRISGRKSGTDRDTERFPYPSQMGVTDSNTNTKPYMSQPHLGLERGRKMGLPESNTSKLSGSSERSPSSDDHTTQTKPSTNQEFPLRTHPRSRRGSAESNYSQPRLSSQNANPEHYLAGLENTEWIGREKNIDGLPQLMDPTNPPAALAAGDPPTASSASPPFLNAQHPNKRPSGQRRPSTANSSFTTTSNTPGKTQGPLLKLKRSFSQLRLSSFSKQHPDVTSPSLAQQENRPPILPSPHRTNTPTRTPIPPVPSSPPVPASNPPIRTSAVPAPAPVPPTPTPPTQKNETQPSSPTTQLRPPTPPPKMIASGALAPMSHPKPIPPPIGTFQRRTPGQPPKLNLQPVNHRISLTIPPTLPTDGGPARFSPTVISRPMPLPLLNLPTLTPRSDSLNPTSGSSTTGGGLFGKNSLSGGLGSKDLGKQKAKADSRRDEERRMGKAHLKSMPALPHHGTGRGVTGEEEVDDMEDDDESTDDDAELDDEEGDSSSRISLSASGFPEPDMGRSSVSSSMSSIASNFDLDRSLPNPPLSSAPSVKVGERQRTPSSGSSYHSARSGFSTNPSLKTPNLTGFGVVDVVPILKQPTPPRGYTTQHQAQASSASASASSSKPLPASPLSSPQSAQEFSPYGSTLPEVDTSRLDLSFLPVSRTSAPHEGPALDVKGKGKARDMDPTSASASSITVTTGGTGVDLNHDPSKTPTATSIAALRFSAVHNGSMVGDGGMGGLNTGMASRRVLNGGAAATPQAHSYSHNQNMTSGVAQSPTETVRQVPLHHGGSGGVVVVGRLDGGGGFSGDNGNGGGMDYFSAMNGFGSGSGGVTSRSRSRPASAYYHSRPQIHSPNTPSTSYTPNPYRHSIVPSSPSSPSQIQTPRPGVGGMKTPANLFAGISTSRRSSALMVDPTGGGDIGGDGLTVTRGGRQVFSMPKMYKRASQSLVDLHTIETKERKRIMEEELRVEEEKELAKLREREREKNVRGKEVLEERHGRRSQDDKIKDDDQNDYDDGDDDDDEAAERRDHLGASVPTRMALVNSPITSTTTSTTTKPATTGAAYDNSFSYADSEAAPPPFSSIATPATTSTSTATLSTTSAAMKKQNRLSTASIYLRRRRSMPMFDESHEPPPYPSFPHNHPSKYKVMPREDEGRERLPPYTNPIYLKAIMPRKMEFTSPGVQARDRKWRRVMCVLEGTVLKVYKCPPGHAGVGVLGEWWEKQVGAGDVSLQPKHNGAVSNIQIETRESRRQAEEQRDIERQIRRIMKAEGESAGEILEDGEPDVVFIPAPTVLVQDGGAPEGSRGGSGASLTQTPTNLSGSSSRSRIAQFLKPGTRTHTRSKSDIQTSGRSTPTPSPRPSLNIPMSGSGATTPGSARSPSPFAASGSMRAQTPMSGYSMSVSGMESTTTGRETPSSSTFSNFRGQQQQQQQQRSPMGLQGSMSQQRLLFTNRERDFLPDPDPGDLVHAYTLQNAESGIGNDYAKRKNVIRLRLEGEQFLLQARDVTGVVEWIEALQAATNIALDLDERPMPRGPLFPRRRRRRRPQIGTAGPSTGSAGPTGQATAQLPVATM